MRLLSHFASLVFCVIENPPSIQIAPVNLYIHILTENISFQYDYDAVTFMLQDSCDYQVYEIV